MSDINSGFFYGLPVELYSAIFNYLDKIVTTQNFSATCKFIYGLDIDYKIYLMNNFDNVYWTKDSAHFLQKYPASRVQLEINSLAHYYEVRKYQAMFFKFVFPVITIFGFYTNIPFDILKSNNFSSTCENYPLSFSEIIDYTTYRQVTFANNNTNNFIWIRYGQKELRVNILKSSEILMGRHNIYTNNNITATHTTTNYFNIGNTEYFISCYTNPMIFYKW